MSIRSDVDEAELVMVLTTVPDKETADRLAMSLIERSLAACVQVESGICSHYVWGGQLHHDDEFRLVIKTRRARWIDLRDALLSEHPYDEPQVICLPIAESSDGYRDWVIQQTRPPQSNSPQSNS